MPCASRVIIYVRPPCYNKTPCRTSVGKSENSGRSPGLSFTHLSASMAVVGVRPELVQATEACSAVRTCARWPEGRLSSASSIVLELDSTKITCSPAGELESTSAADGHQTTHWLGPTATRSRSGIAAWHWPRRSTTCQARRSSGEPGPAAPMADTAIWSTFSWPRANILSARALSLVLVWLVLAFGLCFACSCDQNVRACLLVSSRRYFYKV